MTHQQKDLLQAEEKLNSILKLINEINEDSQFNDKRLILMELATRLGISSPFSTSVSSCENMSQVVGGNMVGGAGNGHVTQSAYHLNIILLNPETVEESMKIIADKLGQEGLDTLIQGLTTFLSKNAPVL